jgi:uncharacterized membrane protein (UPF0127 family)
MPRFLCRSSTVLLLALALATVARAGAAKAASPTPSPTPETVPLRMPSGKVLTVELMRTPEERALGVMGRTSLPRDRGLLFIFEESDFHAFWMKNCKFPIDMIWLDENGRVVHLEESVPPCKKDPCPTYSPMRRARYVVEINAGQARQEQALVGATLVFTLPR